MVADAYLFTLRVLKSVTAAVKASEYVLVGVLKSSIFTTTLLLVAAEGVSAATAGGTKEPATAVPKAVNADAFKRFRLVLLVIVRIALKYSFSVCH